VLAAHLKQLLKQAAARRELWKRKISCFFAPEIHVVLKWQKAGQENTGVKNLMFIQLELKSMA
jgi:hypothetical protein